MNRTRKFIRNTLATGAYQFVLMISGFILPKIILTFYNSEVNGLVSSITQFINYITLVEAGLSGASVFALYKPLAQNNHKEISGIVVATKQFYTISGWIFTAFVLLLAIIYPLMVRSAHMSYWQMVSLVLIIGINGCVDFFSLGKYRALLTADQKQHIISLSSLIYCVLNVAIVGIFAALGFSIVMARMTAVSAIMIRSLILSIYCRKHYKFINYKEQPRSDALNKRWDALILQILGTIHSGAPVVLATIFSSLQEVSVYAVYNMVTNGIASILGIFTTGVGSGFGDLIARKDIETLQKAYGDFEFMYYMFIGLVYSVTAVQIMPFIRLYTQGLNDAVYYREFLGFLFALNGFLYSIKTPQGMMVISAGLYKETKYQTITQALIAVLSGAILGRLYGLAGIMIGMCISNIYRDIDLLFFVPKNVTECSPADSIKNVLIAILGVVCITAIGMKFNYLCNSYLDWIVNSLLICIIAGSVMLGLAFVFRLSMLKRTISRLISIIRR